MKVGLLLIFICSFFSVFSQSDYYWYKGEKKPLNEISSKKIVFYASDNESIETKNKLKSSHKLLKEGKMKDDKGKDLDWYLLEGDAPLDKKLNKKVHYQSCLYSSKNSKELMVSFNFYVKLKNNADFDKLKSFAEKHNVIINSHSEYLPLWYTLACTDSTLGNSVDMANLFYESNLFAAAEPDLSSPVILNCLSDLLFPTQWNFKNSGIGDWSEGIDINYCEASQITTGSSDITVAVYDKGIEKDHPDLDGFHSFSYDIDNESAPAVVYNEHGTCCAGIIGASHNSIGVSGIAPDCMLMDISIAEDISNFNIRRKLASGFVFAALGGADVINCSWEYSDESSYIDDGIEYALDNGRDGLGCVIVFASGNQGEGSVSYPGSAFDEIIVVGALSPCGERLSPSSCDDVVPTGSGSNFGNGLDIVAPGVFIPTTDLTGSSGLNTESGVAGDYTDSFEASSAAAPHVAGVAALILSLKPYLTKELVFEIIARTSQKVGDYDYQTKSGYDFGTWHKEVGYGLLDAGAAVKYCYTLELSNDTYTIDKEAKACNITLENISVSNGASLLLESDESTEIIKDFEVELGSELIIEPLH